MNRNTRHHFLFCLLPALSALLVQCTINLAGNSQDVTTENGKLCGTIHSTDGTPAVNALVMLRPDDYLPALPENCRLGKRNTANDAITCTTTTCRTGEFSFTIEALHRCGTYVIEAVDSAGENRLFLPRLVIDSALLASDTWLNIDTPRYNTVLAPPCKVTGTIHTDTNISGGTVFIYGLENYTTITGRGTFTFNELPAGKYRMKIVVSERSGTGYHGDRSIETTGETVFATDTLFIIRYDGNGSENGTVPLDTGLYTTGEQAVISGNSGNLARKGFTFTGWSASPDGSSGLLKPGDKIGQTDRQIILYAQWAEVNQYTLTISALGNGSVSGGGTVDSGVAVTITATPEPQYAFAEWQVVSGKARIADSSSASVTAQLENGDAEIQAVFKSVTFMNVESSNAVRGISAYDLCFADDGGYFLTGQMFCDSCTVDSTDNSYTWLAKADATGAFIWEKFFSYSRKFESAMQVVRTTDGGIFVAGMAYIDGSGLPLCFTKTDANGDSLWSLLLPDARIGSGGFLSAVATTDGGTAVVAIDNGITFLRISAQGSLEGRVNYPGYTQHNNKGLLRQTADGGFIIGATTQNDNGADDPVLIKTDAAGVLQWQKTFVIDSLTPLSRFSPASNVLQTRDGGYLLMGETSPPLTADLMVFLVKTDSTGAIIWIKTYGKTDTNNRPKILQETNDGDFLIAGYREDAVSFLLKIDTDGTVIWSMPEENLTNLYLTGVQQTADGGYALCGYRISLSNFDFVFIKADADGNF